MIVVFMGTPEFAVPTLRLLCEQRYDVRAVVTQPDRPKGRGRQVAAPPVKMLAERYGIRVCQPPKVRAPEVQRLLEELAPDVIIVAAYGQILPAALLRIPKLGCLNVHASLLPKYRGAAPIHRAIMQGETETGVTTMQMDPGMDTGDVLLWQKIAIAPEDTAETLQTKLSQLGAELLLQTLRQAEQGTLTPQPQDHAAATYAPPLKKEDGRIAWQSSAAQIDRQVRGCVPWPGAYTYFQGKIVKLRKVQVLQQQLTASLPAPGTVAALDHVAGPIIATGEGLLRILEIQPENKKPMRGSDFCRGYHLSVGARFES